MKLSKYDIIAMALAAALVSFALRILIVNFF